MDNENTTTLVAGSDEQLQEEYGQYSSFLIEWLARFNAHKLSARTPTIQIFDENYLEDLLIESRLQDMLHLMFYRSSMTGEAGGTLAVRDVMGKKLPIINIADGISDLVKAGNRIIKGIFTTNYTIGDRQLILVEDFAYKGGVPTMKRYVRDEDGKVERDGINLLQDSGVSVKAEETFEVGEEPVFHYENMPAMDGRGHSDTYGAETILSGLDAAYIRLRWEMDNVFTRIIGLKSPSAMKGGSQEDAMINKLKKKGVYVEAQTYGNILSEGGSPIQVAQATPSVEPFLKSIKSFVSWIMEAKGFARDLPGEKGTAQQNDFEIQQARNSEFLAFTKKEEQGQRFVKDLIFKMLSLAGKPTTNIAVNLNVVSVRDNATMLANIEKAMTMGLESQVEAIAEYRAVSPQQAQAIKEAIDSAQAEAMKQAQANMEAAGIEQPVEETTENEEA